MPTPEDTRPIRPGEELNVEKLGPYLAKVLPGFDKPLEVTQFPAGHSNLTYLLKSGGREVVLRRPPFHNVVKSAHDMGREFRVLAKLWSVYAPAPRPFHYCDDPTVLGDPFYVMERRHGLIPRNPLPAEMDTSPAGMTRLCGAFIDNLALLHKLDYEAAGLADLGKPEGYVARQVAGWSKRYQDSKTDDFGEVEMAAQWLGNHIPAEGKPALLHNDYKFDNLAIDPADPGRIVAVFDWEMCTIGDPLMDLGSALAYWVQTDDAPFFPPTTVGPTYLPGCLTRRQLAERYFQQVGRPPVELIFYFAFGLFKVAVIIQQIYSRYKKGHTRDPRFAGMNERVKLLGMEILRVTAAGSL